MTRWPVITAGIMLLLVCHSISFAHSTRGRVRTVLEKNRITIDDVAYYTEAYVFDEKYKDKYEKHHNRFGVADFIKVEEKDGITRVSFIVLDWRTKKKFEDYMLFRRDPDGIWCHIDEGGRKIAQVYTYVDKKGYYYKKYVMPGSCAGIVLAGGIFIFFRIRNRLKDRSV